MGSAYRKSLHKEGPSYKTAYDALKRIQNVFIGQTRLSNLFCEDATIFQNCAYEERQSQGRRKQFCFGQPVISEKLKNFTALP